MMKITKTLVVMGSLASVVNVANAQSSVTLAGLLDNGIRYLNNGRNSQFSLNTTGYFNSDRIDIIGKEDLGGGYNAHFKLEMGFNPDTGALDNTAGLLFNRMSYVGIGGRFGTVDMGRTYTIAHDILYDYDPFRLGYPTLTQLASWTDGAHYNNNVKYIGDFGPLNFRMENSFGGVPGQFNAGSARSAGLRYQYGWLNIGGLYSHRTVQVGTKYTPDDLYAGGVALTFGTLTISGGFMNENQDALIATAPVRVLNYWGGATYDITPFVHAGAAIYITDLPDSSGKRTQGLASLAYSLSKATMLYSEIDYTKFGGSYITNTALNAMNVRHQLGITVGINHAF